MQNVAATVLAQYAASPRLNALINSFNAALSPTVLSMIFMTLSGTSIPQKSTVLMSGERLWASVAG